MKYLIILVKSNEYDGTIESSVIKTFKYPDYTDEAEYFINNYELGYYEDYIYLTVGKTKEIN